MEAIVICHSDEVGGAGVNGGKLARTATKGCEPYPTYVLRHATRQFLNAADELGIFEYADILYSDLDAYMPDVGKHTG